MNIKSVGSLLLALPLSFGGAAVYAPPSGYSYSEGADASGALLVEGEQVVLEKETVRMRIPCLPAIGSEQPLQGYTATVETEYEFYNGEAQDATMKFLLPCYRPDYMPEDEEPSCEILLNGAAVPTDVRYCYAGYYDRHPDLESGEKRIFGLFDDFYFREDLTVYAYEFSVSVSDMVQGEAMASLQIDLACNPLRTRILADRRMSARSKNGNVCISFDVDRSDTVTLFSIGAPPVFQRSEVCSSNGTPLVGASVSRRDSETLYDEFALRNYPEGCAIGKEDWRNGFSQMLSEQTSEGYLVYIAPEIDVSNFMRWYEYTITVPAGGRATHLVRSAIYPSYTGGSWEFEYLLSPSFRFADINALSVEVDTPYYIRHGTLDLEKDEGGEEHKYSVMRATLPMCEFSFTIMEDETDETPRPAGLSPNVRLAIIILAAIVGCLVVGLAAYFVVVRWRRGGRKGGGGGDAPADGGNGGNGGEAG